MSTPSITVLVVSWAAQECEWQCSGELSVAFMVNAWCYAVEHQDQPITKPLLLKLGRLTEPRTNLNGFRKVGVRVGNSVKMPYEDVPAALSRLLEAQPVTRDWDAAAEWFRVYEEIHPFRDGNGRTGNILYNWLCGTLAQPMMPPNLWNDPRRDID